VSLIDFGLSRILQISGFTTKTISGTWRYVALELFKEEFTPRPPAYFWAWCVYYGLQILTENKPFSHIQNDHVVIATVISGGRPLRQHYRQINDEVWAMLEQCWNAEPNRRPSMDDLCRFFALQAAFSAQQTSSL
jgi:hypothetical protein